MLMKRLEMQASINEPEDQEEARRAASQGAATLRMVEDWIRQVRFVDDKELYPEE